MNKINWGILSTANIGVAKVIPAMQKGDYCNICGIASRDIKKAETAARKLNIPRAYGSYEELLDDEQIQAVYIPLPNHMHVEWTIKCLEAGKHVLCEKPIGMNSKEAEYLLEQSQKHPHLKVMEAFMYRFHPQWHKAKALVEDNQIGEVKLIQSHFSYFNDDPQNIRNILDAGGGGLMDIGCYCISFPIYIYGQEPEKVAGTMEYDPDMKTDRLTSALLSFNQGDSTFSCSTQLMYYQRANIFGTAGRIEIEIPVNAPPDKPARIWLHTNSGTEEFQFDPCDQYTLQGDAFSKAILKDTEVPTPLTDAVANMKVIDSIIESSKSGKWIDIH